MLGNFDREERQQPASQLVELIVSGLRSRRRSWASENSPGYISGNLLSSSFHCCTMRGISLSKVVP